VCGPLRDRCRLFKYLYVELQIYNLLFSSMLHGIILIDIKYFFPYLHSLDNVL